MTIDEIREFIGAAQSHGMREAFIQRGSRSLRVSGLNSDRKVESVDRSPAIDIPSNPAVKAGHVGILRLQHPSGTGDPLGPGQAFKKSQCLAFLQVGLSLMPIVAPDDGTVEEIVAADGDVIGYGAPLLRYVAADR